MLCVKSIISSSATQLLKAVTVSLIIAMCLTSDCASSSAQVQSSKFQVPRSELRSSTSSCGSAATGQRLPSWEYQSWTPLQATLPCEYQKP